MPLYFFQYDLNQSSSQIVNQSACVRCMGERVTSSSSAVSSKVCVVDRSHRGCLKMLDLAIISACIHLENLSRGLFFACCAFILAPLLDETDQFVGGQLGDGDGGWWGRGGGSLTERCPDQKLS